MLMLKTNLQFIMTLVMSFLYLYMLSGINSQFMYEVYTTIRDFAGTAGPINSLLLVKNKFF